jgi:hypothetical protein
MQGMRSMVRWMRYNVLQENKLPVPLQNLVSTFRLDVAPEPHFVGDPVRLIASPTARDVLPGPVSSPCRELQPPNPPRKTRSACTTSHIPKEGCPPHFCGPPGIPPPPYPIAIGLEQPPKPRAVDVPKYDGRYDFVDFRAQFEFLAEDYEWSYEEMGKHLSLCLTHDARSLLPTISRSVRRDYNTLCEALIGLHTFPGAEVLRRKELMVVKRGHGQDPNKFGREMRRLAQQAYPNGDLPELALVTMYILGLNDPQMEAHVSLQEPNTLREAIRHACCFEACSMVVGEPKEPNVLSDIPTPIQCISPDPMEFLTALGRRLEVLEHQRQQLPHNRMPQAVRTVHPHHNKYRHPLSPSVPPPSYMTSVLPGRRPIYPEELNSLNYQL